MQLSLRLAGAVLALAMMNGAALAEVTVSSSTNPTAAMGAEFASLMGTERATLGSLEMDELTALAKGPLPAVQVTNKAAEQTAPTGIDYSYQWLMTQDLIPGGSEWDCLRKALYFEARGETLSGQFAVAEVILNRVDSAAYPDTVCAVVGQTGSGSCQFSYVCDGRSDEMRDGGAIEVAGRIASVMLAGGARGLTDGATYFHSKAVYPSWADEFTRTASIGAHMFYASN
jgi:spore germination cell wall hydrolase CwlJ-like protein